MNNQSVLDVLNSLEVVEQEGGDSPWILVNNTPETRAKLNTVGVTNKQINDYGDDETFCILALACSEGYATDYQDGKLVLLESKDITCKLLNGSEVLMSEGDRVLAVRVGENGLPITTDADSIIDDVLVTLAEAQKTIAEKDASYSRLHADWMTAGRALDVRLVEIIRLRKALEEIERFQSPSLEDSERLRHMKDIAKSAWGKR